MKKIYENKPALPLHYIRWLQWARVPQVDVWVESNTRWCACAWQYLTLKPSTCNYMVQSLCDHSLIKSWSDSLVILFSNYWEYLPFCDQSEQMSAHWLVVKENFCAHTVRAATCLGNLIRLKCSNPDIVLQSTSVDSNIKFETVHSFCPWHFQVRYNGEMCHQWPLSFLGQPPFCS